MARRHRPKFQPGKRGSYKRRRGPRAVPGLFDMFGKPQRWPSHLVRKGRRFIGWRP